MLMLLRIGEGNQSFLNLERVVDGGTYNSFTIVTICSFINLGGPLVVDVVQKVV